MGYPIYVDNRNSWQSSLGGLIGGLLGEEWKTNYDNRGKAKDAEFLYDAEEAKRLAQLSAHNKQWMDAKTGYANAKTDVERNQYADIGKYVRNNMYNADPMAYNPALMNADTSMETLTGQYQDQINKLKALQEKYKNKPQAQALSTIINRRYF